MPLPRPEPGLVICYEFLWSDEYDAGADQGEKKRPCVIVLATRTENDQVQVTVAPITHSEPRKGDEAIELPAKVKAHLGLDSERSWIVIDELNEFVWPGVDLHPVPGGRPGQFDYGFLPPVLYEKIKAAILALDQSRKRTIPREG